MDEYEQSGISAAILAIKTPSKREQEKLRLARSRILISSEDDDFLAYIFETYPEWCTKLSEKERSIK